VARVRPPSPAVSDGAPLDSTGKIAGPPAVRPRAAGSAKRKKPVTGAPTSSLGLRSAVSGQVGLISGIAASAFAVVALASYDQHDVSLSVAGTGQTENLVGPAGSYLADMLYQGFGYASWAVVFFGVSLALRLAGRPAGGWITRILAAVGFVLLATALQLILGGAPVDDFEPGGLLGHLVARSLQEHLGRVGSGLAVGTGLLAVATVLFRIDWQPLAARAVERVQHGAPAAVRGVGAIGAGAVRASFRAGSAGMDALRDRAAEVDADDEEEDEEEGRTGTAGSAAPPAVAPPAGRDLPARRAVEPMATRRATERVEDPPSRASEPPPELPSVWSARRAPPPPPVAVVTGDPDRDVPTKVGGRTLVEVEWEATANARRAELAAEAALPSHLRGATPAPLSRPSRAENVVVPSTVAAPVGRPTPGVPARTAPEPVAYAPAPVVRIPDELDEPAVPERPTSAEWAEAPVAPPWAERTSSVAAVVPPAVVPPVAARPLPPVAPAPPPAVTPSAVSPYPPITYLTGASAPAAEPARPVAALDDVEPDVFDEDRDILPEAPPAKPFVRAESGPARIAPTGKRPRPSGDGITVLPGNLKSGGASDDGRAVRKPGTPFQLPPLSLLDDHPPIVGGTDEAVLHDMARRLTETLRDFQVDGRVTAIRPGPVITMFEYEPAAGVKLSRIANLADNLKMALKAISVRIVAPLPGRGCVGIEIPNEKRQTVWARDVFGSPDFRSVDRSLPMVLGKDTEGRPFITDLAKMPHLLVGGTTGSGKSVGVNSMLVSMLFMRTPEELRMILIDPKMLEFALYEDIPHLLHPVVTEPKFASAVLKWACTEMDERYKIMARWQTRHIDTYNQKVDKEIQDWTPEKARSYAPKDWPDGELLPYPKKFPYIVIVIDELADLMMVASSDVEASISRIVAKARAAGIHLIVATQTPRRDVITGLIKANMPASLAYQVRSALDSRVILDQNGAESLLGKGDLLFLRPGTSDLVRIHAPFLSEDEVHRVADFIRAQGTPDYDLRIGASATSGEDGDEPATEYDEHYDEAVELAISKGKISTSMLQRHLGIGYNRAANIVDTMEREGVVGPADGARPREVLVGQG
jgi:DNA segregation ATPase FtsK/SpoIIIE-like protein